MMTRFAIVVNDARLAVVARVVVDLQVMVFELGGH
jgi:hypothetical protein